MKTEQEIRERINKLRREAYYWRNHAGSLYLTTAIEDEKIANALRWVLE